MKVRQKLAKLSEKSGLNFESILDLTESLNIDFKDAKLYSTIFGLATHKAVFVDINKMKDAVKSGVLSYDKVMFIMYHEIAHHLRIHKIGLDKHIERITTDSLIQFMGYIIDEELFADRWGCLMYYRNTGKVFPRSETQCLDDNDIRHRYERNIAPQHPYFIGKGLNEYEEVLNRYVEYVR